MVDAEDAVEGEFVETYTYDPTICTYYDRLVQLRSRRRRIAIIRLLVHQYAARAVAGAYSDGNVQSASTSYVRTYVAIY